MRELPKYAFLTNPNEFEGMKVIMLEYPYIIASIFEVKQHEVERISMFVEDKAQGRCPIGKCNGYSVFLKMFTSLEPCGNTDFQQTILDEMAKFVLEERVMRKIGQFKGCDEANRTIKEAIHERDERVRLRPRKNK